MTKSFRRQSLLLSWRNTYLQAPQWLFLRVISEDDYSNLLSGVHSRRRMLSTRVLQRIFWFWPRIDDAAGWAQSRVGGQWSPENYLHQDENRLVSLILATVPREAHLMELGCNAGSDMALLHAAGFLNLRGVDASSEALNLFRREYPDVWRDVDVEHDLFQQYLLRQPTNSVDYIYSYGATIELVHPSFAIVKEVSRVARKGVLLEIFQYSNGYRREYVQQFARHGFNLEYSSETHDPISESQLVSFKRVRVTR